MKRRAFFHFSLGLGATLGAGSALATAGPLVWTSRTLNAMGTSMRLQLAHADAAQAERAMTRLTRIDVDQRALESQRAALATAESVRLGGAAVAARFQRNVRRLLATSPARRPRPATPTQKILKK